METFYILLFGVAAVLAAVLEYGNRLTKGGQQVTNADFTRFKNNYLLVYSLAMGEWGGKSPRPTRCRRRTRACRQARWGSHACIAPSTTTDLRAHRCPPLWLAQPATGCRAPMCTPSTSTMGLTAARSAGCSSPGLGPPWSLAPSSARWQTSSECGAGIQGVR